MCPSDKDCGWTRSHACPDAPPGTNGWIDQDAASDNSERILDLHCCCFNPPPMPPPVPSGLPRLLRVCLHGLHATGVHFNRENHGSNPAGRWDNGGTDSSLWVFANASSDQPAGKTSTFKDDLQPVWAESLCLTIDPLVPVCFEVRDDAHDGHYRHNAGCERIRLQREEQTVRLPALPARESGACHVSFQMPDLRLPDGAWPIEAASPVAPPTGDASKSPTRDACLTQLRAGALIDDVGLSLQLWAYSRTSVAHNSRYESTNEAKARVRTGSSSGDVKSFSWPGERLCLPLSDEVCFEVHPATASSRRASEEPARAQGCGPIETQAAGEQSVTLLGTAPHNASAPTVAVRFTIDRRCALCQSPTLPTLIIPFYERDRFKMQVTAKSVAVHGKRAFASVMLIWLSTHDPNDYRSALDRVEALAEPVGVPVHLLDFSPFMHASGGRGWITQQVLKLVMGYLVQTDHYVIFDAKNHIVRELEPETFVNGCNQARIAGENRYDRMPWGWHYDWYVKTGRCLECGDALEAQPDTLLPYSITPFVMNAATARALHESTGQGQPPPSRAAERLIETGGGSSFEYWPQIVGATRYTAHLVASTCTEFTSYTLFALFGDAKSAGRTCWRGKHAVQPYAVWSSSMWTAPAVNTFDAVQQFIRSYEVAPELHPDLIAIGFQAGWSRYFKAHAPYEEIKASLYTIFSRAGILVSSEQGPNDLAQMVDQVYWVGRYWEGNYSTGRVPDFWSGTVPDWAVRT